MSTGVYLDFFDGRKRLVVTPNKGGGVRLRATLVEVGGVDLSIAVELGPAERRKMIAQLQATEEAE